MLSRAARVPSYYDRKTFGRVRQELKIWGVNPWWIVAISASTHAWISERLTVAISGCAISLLEMGSGSSMLTIGVDVSASAGVKRELQHLKWTHTPRRWYWAFYGDRRNKWMRFCTNQACNHRRYLLLVVESSGTTIQRKTGSNLHSPGQCENPRGKFVSRKITVAGLKIHAPSILFSILDSNRLSLLSVSLKLSARTGVRQRAGPKSRHRHFLCLEVCRLLSARHPFPSKSLATNHRYR